MADTKLPRIAKLYKQPLQLLTRKKLVHPRGGWVRGGGGGGGGLGGGVRRKFLRLAVWT